MDNLGAENKYQFLTLHNHTEYEKYFIESNLPEQDLKIIKGSNMGTRILHCGKSVENYNICLKEKIFGFTQRGQAEGDLVYLVVKRGKESLCGARARLGEITDSKPWPDAEHYVSAFRVTDLQFCEPFDIKILQKIGGKHWALKYVQVSKLISDPAAVDLLDKTFTVRDSEFTYVSDTSEQYGLSDSEDEKKEFEEDENIESALPDSEINILATFQTISFTNETDKIRGLETLVNRNFYSLFPQYPEQRSLLIPENRIFITSNLESKESNISGIRGIPDALLLVFNKMDTVPFQFNLIEYECYGQAKKKIQEKSNYLNGHIIPQLMRFASTFSIVTEKQIRDDTIKRWTERIIEYIFLNKALQTKVTAWMREIEPAINEQLIGLKLKEQIEQSLRTNLKIILIIDELSTEQRDTISNVVKAFKLENNTSIQFWAYIVRLEQKITVLNEGYEYALSVQ